MMTTHNIPDPHAELRIWARGLYPLEAATELLIRAGFARRHHHWVVREPSGGTDPDTDWIDFATIPPRRSTSATSCPSTTGGWT
jgi:hypothetical protein